METERKTYSQSLVEERTGRELPELLRELYLDRRYTQQEVADALGVTRSLVGQWLIDLGIRRKDRPPAEVPA